MFWPPFCNSKNHTARWGMCLLNMQTDGGKKPLCYICLTYQYQKNKAVEGVDSRMPCKLVFNMRWGKQSRGFWTVEGVGESGNEPAGTLKEKHISTGLEMQGGKQGVCWTEDKPPDPSPHWELIRGWENNIFQLKEAALFPQKTLISASNTLSTEWN